MKQEIAIADGRQAATMNDNQNMTEPAAAWGAPFAKRAWAELRYALVTLPLSVVAVAFIVPMLYNGPMWAASADGVWKFGAASRFFARKLLGLDVPAPPQPRSVVSYKVRTKDGARLAKAAEEAGGKARTWESKPGVTVRKLPPARIAELAAAAGITIDEMQPRSAVLNYLDGRTIDPVSWRARAYFGLKLPLAVVGLVVAAVCWLGGLYYLTSPAWWSLGLHDTLGFRITTLGFAFGLCPLGAALLFTGPGLLHGVTNVDCWLIRGLLGPSSPTERIRALEESRAVAVDDAAARLRSIERDLHDGAQAQLVALSMKLGLARDKLTDDGHVDLARVTGLVEDAHRGILEAIIDLRTLARGIHPPVLDHGLADALATLATRSAVPVELVTDIPERPSDAIETMAYFSAAELLTNVAKHSGARHATLEAVHVPGLLRIRVTDDGLGGASPVPGGGLCGLADRVRAVDGRVDIDSPRGGPTTVTVELPSHA
ncbi:MAG: sensor domain-containing protein [Streptosporangiaceae bacterium]